MRIVAFIYLAIALVNLWIWVNNGLQKELFPTPSAYLTWGLFALGLLSLLAFTLRRLLIPQRVWQLVFAVYCSTRVYELFTRGLPLSGEDLVADLNTISGYLWVVLPAAMAMWYMGFVFSPPVRSARVWVRERNQVAFHNEHYTEQLP